MKASITDPQVVNAISPIDLASYLRAHGWHRGDAISEGRAHLWLHNLDQNTNIDVIVPADRTVRDYRARIVEALQTLESLEQRSQLEILIDIQQASSDIIRWRIVQADTGDGTIPLEDGQLFITQVRAQLLAAACAAAQPMQFFANRKPAAATEYMRQARLGQSERGSYVVTVQSPVPPALPLQGVNDQPDPFERRVSLTLARGLQSLHQAAIDAADTENLQTADWAANGLSANLCDSMAAMLSSSRNRRDVEVRFSFAAARPAPPDATPATARFSSDLKDIIKEIGRVLRETATRDDFELIGYVIRLDRNPESETGTVIVSAQVDDEFRRVEMDVNAADYERVLLPAHRDRALITCEGELQKVRGRTYRLSNPRSFRAVPTE